jgi:hypothetical protein
MRRRLIKRTRPIGPFGHPGREARIYWCSELREYSVELYTGGVKHRNATYFTPDKQDAENTAVCMMLDHRK